MHSETNSLVLVMMVMQKFKIDYFNLDSTLVGSNFESGEKTIVGKTALIRPVLLPGQKKHLYTHKK